METIYDFIEAGSASVLPDPHPISHRKKIGAFYTPISVTALLCEWGIRTAHDLIMEPCFGGCTFVETSVDKLKTLGQHAPQNNVFGFDIDPLAFKYLATRLGADATPAHFISGDFLMQSSDACGLMDFVVGNPPYIRHNKFGAMQKRAVEKWQEKYDLRLNGRSSLWAYFVMHAMTFLKPGGRVAWVLPGSFLSAKYASAIRQALVDRFERISAITLTERLFRTEGTEELTVILLAEGYSTTSQGTNMEFRCLDSIDELKSYLTHWNLDTKRGGSRSEVTDDGMIPSSALAALAKVSLDPSVSTLGMLANIKIGVVTGNSNFFIKSAAAWREIGIEPQYLQYIVPRSLWLKGISLQAEDEAAHLEANVPCLALDSPREPRAATLTAYLETYSPLDVMANSTFARRETWFKFLDDKIPDAFLVFMTDLGPRLVVNEIAANCTNSLYRVFLNNQNSIDVKLIALSLNSTFSQLSAEALGHGRGSGALKLEPSDASRVRLYLPKKSPESIKKAFEEVDVLIRQKRNEEARVYVDNYLFGNTPECSKALDQMRIGLKKGRTRRMRSTFKEKP